MPSERMRLEAEMKDSASPAIKKLRAELATLQDTTRETRAIAKLNAEIERTRKETAGVHVSPGMRELPKWLSTSTEAMGGFVAKGTNASAVIGGLGIGGLTAAASLAGVVAQMRAIGERSLAMKELGRETGMTVDQINAFSHAGQHFGVGADAMQGAIDHLAGQMPEFRRNYGAMFQELSRWPELIKKLQGEGTEDQIKDIFKFLGQEKLQKEPQLQKQILGALFGSGADMEKLFAQGANGFLNELEKQKRQLGTISPEMLKQAQDFRDSQIKFNDALEHFETTVGPAFLGGMTSIVSSISNAFELLGMLNDKLHGRQSPHENDKAGEENRKNLQPASPDNPFAKGKLRLKMSNRGGAGGMLQLASFGGDDGSAPVGGGMVDTLAAGTKLGFLAALREYSTASSTGNAGGGGLVNASLTDGGGGIGAGTGGRGAGGGGAGDGRGGGLGPGTAVDKTLPKEARALLDAISAGEAPDYNVLNGGGRFNDMSHHPGGRAAGRYQDLPSTWRRIAGATGLKDFSPESQDKGNWWLAQQDYRSRTHRDLLGDLKSGNPGVIANVGRALHSTWVSTNGSFAGRYAGALGRGDGGPAGSASGIGLHLHTLSEQCVDLARAAVGASGTVREWRRGVGAIEGTLKPGTPVATFLDRAGKLSERYAGGGVGTPGAHLDHAGVFQSYIRDKSGKPIGMNIAEQYKGSHGAHSKSYMFGRGWGEGNGSNYSAIMGPDGQALGGDRNPMNRRATGLNDPAASSAAGGSRHHLDVHVHDRGGSVMSTSMRSHGSGMTVDHRLTRWPTRNEVSST